jgi:hypothetical protein
MSDRSGSLTTSLYFDIRIWVIRDKLSNNSKIQKQGNPSRVEDQKPVLKKRIFSPDSIVLVRKTGTKCPSQLGLNVSFTSGIGCAFIRASVDTCYMSVCCTVFSGQI